MIISIGCKPIIIDFCIILQKLVNPLNPPIYCKCMQNVRHKYRAESVAKRQLPHIHRHYRGSIMQLMDLDSTCVRLKVYENMRRIHQEAQIRSNIVASSRRE